MSPIKRNCIIAFCLFIALLVLGCSGCNDTPPSADTDTDVDSDSDTDIDTDTDSDTDTDTDSDTDTDTDTDVDIDWGDPIPCENDPLPGEICVPGGKHVLGCVPGDVDCEDNEKPLVQIYLSPFFMEEMEATNEEVIVFLNTLRKGYIRNTSSVSDGKHFIWITFVDGTPIQLNEKTEDYEWISDGDNDFPFCLKRTPQSSAGGLSWWGAKLYCEWKGMQLPTEAQWEASARGQTLNEYPCGSDLPICWYGRHACCQPGDPCFDEYWCHECCIPFDQINTCESPYGIKNHMGNATEWVLDWKDDDADHSGVAEGTQDPEPTTGLRPICKGGGVGTAYTYTRISHRVGATEDGGPYTGVRCVRPDVPANPDAGPDGGKK